MADRRLTRRQLIAAGSAGALTLLPSLSSAQQWQNQGDAAASNTAALNADPKLVLRHSGDKDYRVTSYRTIEGLAPGSYRIRAKARSSGGQPSVFAFARVAGYSLARTSVMATESATELVVPGVPVGADGILSVGLHSEALAGQWAELSDIEVQRETIARPFLAGGDVSVLTWMEAKGARFSDRRGRPGDALKILRDNGHSIVRLRLYDAPGKGHGADGFYWPAGYMDLPDVLSMARRAHALGMQIQLSLHYSDFWTNNKLQMVPSAWAAELAKLPDDASRMERLRALVFERTRDVMLAMKAQGTTPQFVSLGNEIEGGMLYPWGKAEAKTWPQLGALLRAGCEAVKAVSSSTRVILHLDDAGNMDKYRDWFDNAVGQKVPFDVIGSSYYPFWTKKDVAKIVEFSREVTARYDRDLFIMEAGFNFHPTLPGGWKGQLTDNGPYPDSMSSPAGQRAFIDELFNSLKRAGRVLGVLYWDPIMIERPGIGWALRESDDQAGSNVVSNTTLFDFTGRALPVLDVWRDHAPAMPLART